MRPQIDGEWWQIAANPDLGKYNSPDQQPVDFAVWQAADGTWQLWSCIRHTACGEKTRLFYRWQAGSLTQSLWDPVGIAMEAEPDLAETSGGLQAPDVIEHQGTYLMFYGDWSRICLATSRDGKLFTRTRNQKGQPDLFSGPFTNTRDPMVLKIGHTFRCYYTGHRESGNPKAAVFCRTSDDLLHWSEPVTVAAGGAPARESKWHGGDCECPFVVELSGLYYLFRNQRYGLDNLNIQYCSPDPLYFGVDDDSLCVGTLPVAAPEIIHHDGQHYIAALLPTLDGIRMAKLSWLPS